MERDVAEAPELGPKNGRDGGDGVGAQGVGLLKPPKIGLGGCDGDARLGEAVGGGEPDEGVKKCGDQIWLYKTAGVRNGDRSLREGGCSQGTKLGQAWP